MDAAARSPVTKYWGTPDPRDADAYPKATSATPMTQWAWEFLRRSSDYRNAWEKLVQPFLNGQGGFDQAAIDRHYKETKASAIQEQCGHRGPWRTRQELVMARPWGETGASQERRGYRWQAPWIALQDRFRVSGESNLCNFTLDPRLARPPLFDGTYIKEVLVRADRVKLPKVLLEFDVQLPLERQLKYAREALIRRRNQLGEPAANHKLQVDKFPLDLRLLDFHFQNATDNEMGNHLFPNHLDSSERLRDIIRKSLAAAFRWQRDYLIIALHRPDAS